MGDAGLKTVARKIVPSKLRTVLGRTLRMAGNWGTELRLARLRHRLESVGPGSDRIEPLLNYTLRINEGMNFYSQVKEIFIKRIYHFEAVRPDPLILDCGSNIGGPILYYKMVYPQARIIGFEPDPALFPYLQENVTRNRLENVSLLQAALTNRQGTFAFYSDGKSGSFLATDQPRELRKGWTRYEVPCVRLREYLGTPVDFLKMNIEGAEWEVLADSEDHLRQVREMVIEYHHMPGLPRTLHKILTLLDRQGFEYLINDFDSEINGTVDPPFRLAGETMYFLLIYAKRKE